MGAFIQEAVDARITCFLCDCVFCVHLHVTGKVGHEPYKGRSDRNRHPCREAETGGRQRKERKESKEREERNRERAIEIRNEIEKSKR